MGSWYQSCPLSSGAARGRGEPGQKTRRDLSCFKEALSHSLLTQLAPQ